MRTIKTLLLTAAALVFGIAGNCFADEAAKAVVPTSHVDLFNGKDFTGWKFVMRSNAEPANTWSITNGVIHCTGQPYGYARTQKNYASYKLTVEWRFVRVAPKADNSGIFVNITAPDKVWPACVEAQGQHHRQGDLHMNGGATAKGHTTADTKNADVQSASNEKPVGDWNTYVIECSGDSVKLWTNDKFMNEVTGCSVTSGGIGLQSEGGEIEVRKVFLEPLSK